MLKLTQMVGASEAFIANVTAEGPFIRMGQFMSLQMRYALEYFRAFIAFKLISSHWLSSWRTFRPLRWIVGDNRPFCRCSLVRSLFLATPRCFFDRGLADYILGQLINSFFGFIFNVCFDFLINTLVQIFLMVRHIARFASWGSQERIVQLIKILLKLQPIYIFYWYFGVINTVHRFLQFALDDCSFITVSVLQIIIFFVEKLVADCA